MDGEYSLAPGRFSLFLHGRFLICFFVLAITILTTRYVSLGSILGGVTTIICGIVFFVIGLVNPEFFAKVTLAQLVFMLIGPALVIIVHYDNIGRLLSGNERKLGQKVVVEEGTSPANSSSSTRKHNHQSVSVYAFKGFVILSVGSLVISSLIIVSVS